MTQRERFLAGMAIAILCGAGWVRAQASAPDLILTNGKIITVDDRFTIAQAVAVKGDRIVAVGSTRRSRRWRRRRRGASICMDAPWFPDSSTTTCTCSAPGRRGADEVRLDGVWRDDRLRQDVHRHGETEARPGDDDEQHEENLQAAQPGPLQHLPVWFSGTDVRLRGGSGLHFGDRGVRGVGHARVNLLEPLLRAGFGFNSRRGRRQRDRLAGSAPPS